MSEPKSRRAPQVFDVDDPALRVETEQAAAATEPLHGPGKAGPHAGPQRRRAGEAPGSTEEATEGEAGPAATGVAAGSAAGRTRGASRGLGWGAVLFAALTGLLLLAAGQWAVDFVAVALSRSDWLGLLAWGLLALATLAASVIVLREVAGLLSLSRLSQVRADAEQVLRDRDRDPRRHPGRERAVVHRLRKALAGRGDLAWSMARFREHEDDVHDPGELLALADREIMAPLDRQARGMILASAKRVSVVTALSPIAFVAVGFVLIENLGLLRRLASLYGGRPGLLGGVKLARMVLVHMVATGGVALTDDLIGQFIGQDLIRRLSRRLGEGLINGALTARVGAAAVEVIRPLPFISAPPVRMRDMVSEFLRRAPTASAAGARG